MDKPDNNNQFGNDGTASIGHNNPPETLQQLNMSYDAREDRIILRLGTNHWREFSYWITYRLYNKMQEIFDVLEQQIDVGDNVPKDAVDAVKEFKKAQIINEQHITSSKDKKPNNNTAAEAEPGDISDVEKQNIEEEETQSYEAVHGDTPLLIDSINVSVKGNIVMFSVISGNVKTGLPMPIKTVFAMQHLLQQTATRSEWLISHDHELAVPAILN